MWANFNSARKVACSPGALTGGGSPGGVRHFLRWRPSHAHAFFCLPRVIYAEGARMGTVSAKDSWISDCGAAVAKTSIPETVKASTAGRKCGETLAGPSRHVCALSKCRLYRHLVISFYFAHSFSTCPLLDHLSVIPVWCASTGVFGRLGLQWGSCGGQECRSCWASLRGTSVSGDVRRGIGGASYRYNHLTFYRAHFWRKKSRASSLSSRASLPATKSAWRLKRTPAQSVSATSSAHFQLEKSS